MPLRVGPGETVCGCGAWTGEACTWVGQRAEDDLDDSELALAEAVLDHGAAAAREAHDHLVATRREDLAVWIAAGCSVAVDLRERRPRELATTWH